MDERIRRLPMRLSTEEAAARLGVKKETIYAYVSRGILSRQKAVDGKASTFDADEVDRLRRQRLGGHPGRLEAAVTTAVADVRDGVVAYRGRSITKLADSGTSYEEVAALLWDVPFTDAWTAPPALVKAVGNATRQLPAHATLIDHLLASAVMAGAHDPFRNDRRSESAAASMRDLVAATVEALPMRKQRQIRQRASIAERLWPRLTPASSANSGVLDQTLMVMADHGIASSTLAARIAASTRGGPHAAVIAGLGALNGPLHGAASRSVHKMLTNAEAIGVSWSNQSSTRSEREAAGYWSLHPSDYGSTVRDHDGVDHLVEHARSPGEDRSRDDRANGGPF